jgi:hypothetical protein
MKISRNIKYVVIIIFIVFFLYIINYFSYSYSKEGFNPNALLTYDSNSPKNSHNVDVVNNPYSCTNFCGPKATCLKTGEQCTSDVDCYGCQLPINKQSIGNNSVGNKLIGNSSIDNSSIDNKSISTIQLSDGKTAYVSNTDVIPMDDAGKLTLNQPPQYSRLTSDIGSRAANAKPGSLNEKIVRPYDGYDKWTKSFNYGLDLAEEKLIFQYSPAPEEYRSIPTYPVTISATGLFYDTGPTAANATM